MNIFGVASIILVMLMAAMVYRVAAGPTIFDRFLGAFMSGTTAALALALIGFWFGQPEIFIDILLAYALLNFVMGIVAGKFLEQRRGSP